MQQHDRPWRQNDGRKPRAPPETLCEIVFANGNPARHLYQIQQLTWDIRGWDHDVARYRRG